MENTEGLVGASVHRHDTGDVIIAHFGKLNPQDTQYGRVIGLVGLLQRWLAKPD